MKHFFFFVFCTFVACLPTGVFAKNYESTDTMLDAQVSVTQTSYYKGKVIDIVEEIPKNDFDMFEQTVHIQLLDGDEKGREISVPYEITPEQAINKKLKKGDTVILNTLPGENPLTYYINEIYRLPTLGWLLGFFMMIAFGIARRRALQAMFGLVLSFGVIVWFVLPRILAGDSPVLISLIGSTAIMSISIYLAHGVRTRTTIAFLCSIGTAAIGIGFATIAVHAMSLFGMGSEEAFYLQFSVDTVINLRGLLLGGIIIGMLGVLDDVTTTQAATVEEIHLANSFLSRKELYRRGASVGREHITSLINTLVLAYTGAALPLLLLFQIYDTPLWVTLNSEIVMEEVVRMIVGSVVLILAVPITTYIAAWWYGRADTKFVPK
ncbi:MAG: YibE/F family protein [uncultured bacterium]|nr:MAG: YibE/F family protein [uncultured bacterium]